MTDKKKLIIAIAAALIAGFCLFFVIRFAVKNADSEQDVTVASDESGSEKEKNSTGETKQEGAGVEEADFDETTASKSGGENTEPTTQAETGSKETADPSEMTFTGTAKEYEAYCSLSVEDQYEVFKKYFGYTKEQVKRYNDWYQTAKNAYQKEHPAITLEPGVVIDLGN